MIEAATHLCNRQGVFVNHKFITWKVPDLFLISCPNLLNYYSLLTFLDEEGDIVMGFPYKPMGNGVWPKASTATHKP